MILWTRTLIARAPFGTDWPVVCLTQTTRQALGHLTSATRYSPCGIAFSVQSAFDAGGGPALYVRGDEFDGWRAGNLADHVKARAVRYWPGSSMEETDDFLAITNHGQSQWLHEREWRIPKPLDEESDDWSWSFDATDVAFLLGGHDVQREVSDTLQAWSEGTGYDVSWVKEIPFATYEGSRWVGGPDRELWP